MTASRLRFRVAGSVIVLAAMAAGGACHWKSPIKPMIAKRAAQTLALPGSVLTSHPDPEIVRSALSYAMLQNEALLMAAPRHDDLLLTTCSEYVQYIVWFAQPEAEAAQAPTQAKEGGGNGLLWLLLGRI